MMSQATLKVKLFDVNGTQVIPIAKSNLSIGSAKHCDIVFDHSSVQGEHLRAWFDAGRIWVQDMGSSSGTYLNGIRLPSLKPMLVRELDILKIGDNPVTVGMEANLVRSPVVRPKMPIEDQAPAAAKPPAKDVPDDSEIEKKRDELAGLRRELAELRLQLQIGRLDKESEDEAHRNLSKIRNEILSLQDTKAKLERNLKQMEQQREAKLKAVEKEIAERKTSAMNQLKNLLDHEMSKLAEWKMKVMAEIRREIHNISQSKARIWVTRPLSQDMILEWEADIQALMRRVLLGESPEQTPNVDAGGPPQIPSTPPLPADSADTPPEVTRSHKSVRVRSGTNSLTALTRTPVPRLKKKLVPRDRAETLKYTLVILAALSLVAAAILFKKGLVPAQDREPAATESNETGAAPKHKFEPQQSRGFKKSYTDNFLYTVEYIEKEFDPRTRALWVAKFNAAAKQWKLDAKTVSAVAEREWAMIQDLLRLRNNIDGRSEKPGIQAMRDREALFFVEAEKLFRAKSTVDKFNRLKRTFFSSVLAKN